MIKNGYKYKTKGNTSYLYLYQRKGKEHTIVLDTFNLDKVISYKYKWFVCFHKGTNDFYARATEYLGLKNGKRINRPILLHKFLLSSKKYQNADHRNHNTLDNRMKNLRPITFKDNSRNRKKRNSNNTSGYRNVTLILGWWRVQLQIDGKNYLFPEKFKDVHEAGRFAEKMRKKYYGEFSGSN